MNLRYLWLFFFLFFFVAASHGGKLSPVNAVQIESEVGKPGHFIYYGTTDAVMGGLFGIGAIISGMGPDKEGAEIQSRLRSAGFAMDREILADFKRELSSRTLFASGGSHRLRLDITRYGIGVAPTGFKRLKPVLEGQVTIRDGAGKQVYFLRRAVSDMDDVVRGQTYEEYVANIQLLVRDMKVLSSKLAQRLVETMEKDRKGSVSSSEKTAGSPASKKNFKSR